MGCMDVSGSESRPQSMPTTDPYQRDVSKAIGEYLLPKIGQAAEAYTGQITAGVPQGFTDAYDNLFKQMGGYADIVLDTLRKDTEGKPAYEYDESATAKRWQSGFAAPVMETWERTIKPMVEQSFAGIPGGFYSTDRGRGVRDQAQDFYSQYVMPSLYQSQEADIHRGFQSTEAAAARAQPAAMNLMQAPGAMFGTLGGASGLLREMQQQGLSADYGEWLRTRPEQSPWLTHGLSYMGIPTTTVGNKQDQWGDQLGAQWLAPGLHWAAMASDRRFKENIKSIDSALDKISILDGKTYNYKTDMQPCAGLIAQDVESVLPEGVVEKDGMKYVRYESVIGLLTNAVKELNEKVETLLSNNSLKCKELQNGTTTL